MNCIFCKIINKEIEVPFLYEDKNFIAIKDKFPKAPTHILVIPKKHIHSIAEAEEGDTEVLGEILLVAKKVAAEQGLKDYKLIFNNGKYAEIGHLHLHLVSGAISEQI